MTYGKLMAGVFAMTIAVTALQAQAPQGTRTAGAADSQTFVNEMAVAGMAEVELGTLATQRAQNADVKAFGQMMIKDHTQANSELTQIAKQMKVTVPTQLDMKHRDLRDRLSKLNGAEFDREYMTAMVTGHEEVLAKLKAKAGPAPTSTSTARPAESVATTGSQDAALTQWASKALPTVEQHLERAKALQQKVK
jgi:putative membrane protein